MIGVRRPAAGTLIHSVDLYGVPSSTLDDYGQPSTTGVKIGTFRANVQPISGQILSTTKANWPEATHKVTLPWLGSAIPITTDNPDRKILPSMYLILDDGTRLEIIFADDVGRLKKLWILTCKERVVT